MLDNEPTFPARSSLEIHLLGPFRLIVDGQALDERRFTRRKPKLLIKLLALQAHHQLHREEAMELLWPESDPESATNNLHKAIHLARHALELELKSGADSRFLITQGQQILLRAPDTLWIDVDAFGRRRDANNCVCGIRNSSWGSPKFWRLVASIIGVSSAIGSCLAAMNPMKKLTGD